MITNTGRTIIAKYLIGQAPAYASHIALGVGAIPLDDNDVFDNYSAEKDLKFEVLRIPITSKGYVYDEDGSSNIVFAGELPGDQRYLFTEIGVFSARSNPAAGTLGSKMLYTFSESENWEFHNETTASSIPLILVPLDANASAGTIDNLVDGQGNPVVAFRTNSNNDIFNNNVRTEIYEQPRFLDRALIVPGNMSYLESVEGKLQIATPVGEEYNGSHIHLLGIDSEYDRNSSQDQMRLAFSILDKTSGQSTRVGGVRILMEFASTDAINPDNFARFEVDLDNSDIIFADNRYVVVTKTLGDLVKSSSFTWNTVNSVKIYVTVYDDTLSEEPSGDFYVALDGFRLENVTAQNPLYGMTGYTVVKTEDGLPIAKEPNSSNIVEFRFGMDIV